MQVVGIDLGIVGLQSEQLTTAPIRTCFILFNKNIINFLKRRKGLRADSKLPETRTAE